MRSKIIEVTGGTEMPEMPIAYLKKDDSLVLSQDSFEEAPITISEFGVDVGDTYCDYEETFKGDWNDSSIEKVFYKGDSVLVKITF